VQPELHERARLLLDRGMTESIPVEKQRWLDHHLSECAECSRHAELNRRAIQALDSFAFDLDHAAALRVQEAVTRRAERMRSSEPLAVPLAIALTIAGSFVMWQAVTWLAGQWNLPNRAWQFSFVVFWILPSVLIDMVLLFRGRLRYDS
jgi:hypothetical protein